MSPSASFNAVLFGETGVGKSSVINIIAGRHIAETSSDTQGCTMSFRPYTFPLREQSVTIWDTVGLEESGLGVNGFLHTVEQSFELIQHITNRGGIDLLLFCIRGGRVTATTQSNYRLFYEVLCHSKVPIALIATHLEGEVNMEQWWERNRDNLKKCGINVADHACITGLPTHSKYRESQKNMATLLSRFDDQNRFTMPPENWFIESLRLFGLFTPLRKGAQRRDILRVLVKRCRMDPKLAEDIADMLLGTGPSPLGVHKTNQQEAVLDLTEQVKRTSKTLSENTLRYIWKEGDIHHTVVVKFVIGLNRHKKYRVDLKLRQSLIDETIVPLCGVVDKPFPGMVTRWYTKSLSEYLYSHLSLSLDDKKTMLGDVAIGLRYLHNQKVVHGNLHSNNILIKNDGACCLTDLSFTLPNKFIGASWLENSNYESLRFADPKLAMQAQTAPDQVISPTKYCDVYSFGGVILHVLFGTKPYGDLGRLDILEKLLHEELPDIPSQTDRVPPGYESLIKECWNGDDTRRPLVDAIVRKHWFSYR